MVSDCIGAAGITVPVARITATPGQAPRPTSESGFTLAKCIKDASQAENWEVLIAYAQIVSTHMEQTWSASGIALWSDDIDVSKIISHLMDSVYERVCGPSWKQLSAGAHGPMNYGEMGPK
jgi:hypothetical protein